MWKELLHHHYHQMVTVEQASNPEHWHAVEDKRGKLLQLRPELLRVVCSGSEDSQAHYLGGRTTLAREIQEKAVHA